MKKYNKFDIDRVKSAADIRDFIPGLSGRGATQYCECPECHKSGRNKGLCVTHKTNMDIAKCFSCGFTINGAIDAVQYYDKVEFIDALQIVASRYNILLETEMEKRQRAIDRSTGHRTKCIWVEIEKKEKRFVGQRVVYDDGIKAYKTKCLRGFN